MTDTKQKCQGCGAETMSDVGWCPACRSILYTDLQIAKSDFRQSEFKTMVFPVRDVIWLQERVRLRDAEIKAMDIVNDEMGVTILSLRDELARLRVELEQAPTATLRQQLAGSQSALSKVMSELTEAREQLERRRIDYAKVQADLYNQIEAEKAQTAEAYRQRDIARAALAEAERERDEARAEAGEWRNMAVSVADQIEKSAGINSAGYAEYVRDSIAICETILAERQQAERGQAGKE